MSRLLTFVLVVLLVSAPAWGADSVPASSRVVLSPEVMQSALDFAIEKVNAVSTTTDLGPDADLQAGYAELSKRLLQPLPAYEFANSLNRLLATLQDAHTSAEFSGEQRRLPIRALWQKEGLIVAESFGPFSKGDRIVRVGSFKARDLLLKIEEITPHENDFFVRGIAPSVIFREDFLRSIQSVDESGFAQVEFERQGKQNSIQIGLVEPAPSSESVSAWYSFSLDDERSVARIRLDRCDFDRDFADALRSFMRQIHEKKIGKLVIDLRRNRGGDALVAFALASYLDPDYRSFSLRVRRSQELLHNVPAYAQFLNDSNRIPESRNLHELSAEVVKAVSIARLGQDAPTDPELRFRGKVYLLTSPLTFSSANLFATLFKDNHLATVVGEPTGNEVEFRGEGVQFEIPGTPLRLSVSSTRYQRPDRTHANGVALMPDVLVPDSQNDALIDEVIEGDVKLPEFHPSECVGDDTGMNPVCGYVSVPENRLRPDGSRVNLAVRVFRRLDLSSREEPLVYLHGGPGTSGIAFEGKKAFNFNSRILPFLAQRDVILFDQRGVGLSLPSLDCPEFPDSLFPRARDFIHREEYMPAMLGAASACANRLRSRGIRLESYNTNESADDADDIRQALRIDTWDLLGNSYGTRLGLNILRRKPEGVRAAVFSSLHPPQLGFDSHARFARLVEKYFAQFPELKAQLEELTARLDRDPLHVTTRLKWGGSPWSNRDIDWLFSGDQLSGLLYGALYSPASANEFRNLAARLLQGDSRGLDAAIADNFVTPMSLVNIGSLLAINCNDRLSRVSQEELKREIDENPLAGPLMYGRDLMWGEDVVNMCHAFVDPSTSDPRFSEPVRSRVPTLLISGEFDSATPPENAALAAQTLGRSQQVVIPGAGHAPVFEGACPKSLALAFLSQPFRRIDPSCLENEGTRVSISLPQ